MILRTRNNILVVSALLLVGGMVPAQAATIILDLSASQDTWLATGGGFETGNGGSDPYLYEDPGGAGTSFGLLQFDLKSIPQRSRITRATLSLYQVWNGQAGFYLDLFQIITPWEETAVTGETAPSYLPDPAARLLVEDANTETWRNWDLTSTVASWIEAGTPNYGLRIERTASAVEYPFFVPWPYIVSREGNALLAPSLTIEYTHSPEPATLAAMFGALAVFAGRAKIRSWRRKSAF